MRRTARRTLTATVLAGVLVACSNDAEPRPLDLTSDDGDGIDVADAQDPDADAAVEDPGDDEVAAELPEPAYPPLPPFEVDPDSDLDEDEQREIYEFYVQAYDAMQGSLAAGSPDPRLEDLLAEPALGELMAAVELLEGEGVVSLAPTMRVEPLRYYRSEAGVVVLECRHFGEGSGRYDAETGVPVELGSPGETLIVSLVVAEGVDGELKILDSFEEDGPDACAAAAGR